MKIDNKIKKILANSNISSVLRGFLNSIPLEKLMLELANQCVYKSHSDKSKKRRKQWYRIARTLHRVYDEINLEKQKRNVFKVVRRDYYLCPKCKKKFIVDVLKEQNAQYDINLGVIVVKCPHCGFSE